jgi:hypothetical protein
LPWGAWASASEDPSVNSANAPKIDLFMWNSFLA